MKKKLILLFSMMLCIMSLVGCGAGFKKPTVEEVLEKMQTKMKDATSMESTMVMDIEMTMGSQGFEAPMDIDGEFDFEVFEESDDNGITHISGLTSVDAMGEVLEEEFESYTVIDGDEVTTYTSSDGYWVKETSERDEDEDNENVFDFSDFEEDLKLEEDTEKYNGVDCYVLRGKVDSESLSDFPAMSMNPLEDVSDDSIDMTMSLFVNKKSYELVGFVVSADSFEEEADGLTVSLDKMVMELKVNSFNSLDKIKIPKSVLDAASNESYIYFEDDSSSEDFDFDFEDEDAFEDEDLNFSFEFSTGDNNTSDDYDDEEDSKKPDNEETQQQSDNEDASTSSDDKDKDTSSGDVATETNEGICTSPWTDMKFMFEGKELHLPDPYSTFEVNGWYYSPEENGVTADYVLNANEYSIGTTSLSNDKYDDFEVDVNIGFSNPNNSTTKLTDCNVWTFSADVYYAMKNSSKYPSMSVNGLQFGDSEDKLLEKLGTDYYSTYHSDSLGYTTYDYRVDYDLYFELCVYPDYGITEMSLKSYP